jgi:hypothetical protein
MTLRFCLVIAALLLCQTTARAQDSLENFADERAIDSSRFQESALPEPLKKLPQLVADDKPKKASGKAAKKTKGKKDTAGKKTKKSTGTKPKKKPSKKKP